MSLGKQIRLNRIFAHRSGRLCSAAIDHFMIYAEGLPPGLRQIKKTLAALMTARPDAVTMHKGLALSLWEKYAGSVPLILQSSAVRPDDSASERMATPEEAVRLGADAIAIVAYVRGKTEATYLRAVADCVRDAGRFGLPVMCHVYPRSLKDLSQISYAAEDIAWAVRCIVEVGADVVKAPFCGDVKAHAQIVSECPSPLVVAGGPKTATLLDGLQLAANAIASGTRGAIIGRNVWGSEDIAGAMLAFKAVIHDGKPPLEAFEPTVKH
jgi:class I fructose-bisphosphate aldolase